MKSECDSSVTTHYHLSVNNKRACSCRTVMAEIRRRLEARLEENSALQLRADLIDESIDIQQKEHADMSHNLKHRLLLQEKELTDKVKRFD